MPTADDLRREAAEFYAAVRAKCLDAAGAFALRAELEEAHLAGQLEGEQREQKQAYERGRIAGRGEVTNHGHGADERCPVCERHGRDEGRVQGWKARGKADEEAVLSTALQRSSFKLIGAVQNAIQGLPDTPPPDWPWGK